MPAVTPIPASRRATRAALCAMLGSLVLAATVGAPAATAADARYEGSSTDGEFAFFSTTEGLVPGDTDNFRDVYVRYFDDDVGDGGAYVTRIVSTGPSGGNDNHHVEFFGISDDGRYVFFGTAERLTAEDTDKAADIYVRDLEERMTTLVSRGHAFCEGSGCGNGPFDANFADLAGGDGLRVLFTTAEGLVETDTDNTVDVYLRDLEFDVTTLVSAGEDECAPAGCGSGNSVATLRGASADGTRAFFTTGEPLAVADQDSAIDTYAHDLPDGPTALVSAGDSSCAPCGNSDDSPASFSGSSTDGDHVFFETDEGLVGTDEDGENDVYARDLVGGTTALLSGGEDDEPANFLAASANGARALFRTGEALVPEDTNGASDIYAWSGGAPSLVSSGRCCNSDFAGATADAETVFFTTIEQLDPVDDIDDSADIYAQDLGGGAPALISRGADTCAPDCGNDEIGAGFNAISSDASRVFFTTSESLVPEDVDSSTDIYVRDLASSTTTLVTPPPGFCPLPKCPARFGGISTAGDRTFFETEERLTFEDIDTETDVYERDLDANSGQGVTRLVSVGNSPGLQLGPPPPTLTGTDPESPNVSKTPKVLGEAAENAKIRIYTRSDCAGEVAGSGTAEDLESGGIEVVVEAGATTSFWADASDENGDISPCSATPTISYTQKNPAPPPPPPPPGGGSGDGDGGSGLGAGAAVKARGGGVFVAPKTRITFGPSFKTRKRKVVFRFTDSTGQPGTRFSCRLDRRHWRRCGSPTRLRRLGAGAHVFRVKAVNGAGEAEARAAKRRFKVVRR